MSKAEKYEKAEMVDWYDPRQLLGTAKKTFISTTIGEHVDPRLATAEPKNKIPFDYSKELARTEFDFEPVEDTERNEIWIDYAADVGDGWNSTYAVAYSLAQTSFKIQVNGIEKTLKRGEILLFGGDGVYPTADSKEYEKRLVTPYRMAFKASGTNQAPTGAVSLKAEPHLFALPGNHDWYDSLVSFRKLFCSHIFNDRRFAGYEAPDPSGGAMRRGGWRTRQKRSYFALKLPHNWWLLGIDMQLSHNIDVSQLQYFQAIVELMEPGDKVILCVPEPYWVKAIKYQKLTDKFEEKEASIEKLEKFFEKQGIKVKVYIAGDLHHYRRFESDDGSRVHKITAGGGGAFLHPTHDFDFDDYEENQTPEEKIDEKIKGKTHFSLRGKYPLPEVSSRLDWKNLYLFWWNNKTFGIFTAIIYASVAWLIHGEITGGEDFSLKKALTVTLNRFIDEPLAGFVIILMLLALVFFTDSNSKRYKWIGGLIHGLFHLAAIFVTGWLGYLLSVWVNGKYNTDNNSLYENLIWFGCVVLVSLVGGYLIGSIIMGVYLFVSLHIFGRHDNEAFSALKIEDYKNFLRLHIDPDGNLNIYPLKIEKVPRRWNPIPNKDQPEFYQPAADFTPEPIESINPIK